MGCDIKQSTKGFKLHVAHTQHAVVVVVICNVGLCVDSIMSHSTLILYYHASTLTLETSFMSCALWWKLGRVESV